MFWVTDGVSSGIRITSSLVDVVDSVSDTCASCIYNLLFDCIIADVQRK